ncbi:type II toxin-antitoxin system RelE/ParE family toxin [Asticcacaulis solisilvae]|uniref:type II toxin-antitoxin system RelE/ParE family toxin n=1 Tax=Asticcacaulis solisilvae TaxID=1217274 RepID=UPI003FD70E5B
MKVVITGTAEADLVAIADFIALDSPRRAVTFVRELLKAALGLGDYPTAYPFVPRYEGRGIRRRPYGNYLILYAVRHDSIVVQRILNAAQDYEALLFPEE